jgi:hypothetical protein
VAKLREPWDLQNALRWSADGGDVWVSFEWQEIGGRLECVGLKVWRPNRPLTASFIRSVRWSEIIEIRKTQMLKAALREAGGRGEPLDRLPVIQEETQEARARLPLLEKSAKKRGRPGYGIEHFQEVARVYTEAFRAGIPPTRAVADAFYISRPAAAKQVARARNDFNLLPKTEPRKMKARKAKTAARRGGGKGGAD